MSIIYFARHGQASFGKRNYDSLCDRGREQSRILGEHLVKLGLSFDAVYSGEMERQKQTAYEVGAAFSDKGLVFPEVRIMNDFNEFDFQEVMKILLPDMIDEDPSMEGDILNMFEDKKAFQKIVDLIMSRWISGNYDKPGILGWKAFMNRIQSGINRIMEEGGSKKNIIIFSSGGPISAVVQMALEISDEMTARLCWQIYNASLTRFMYNSKDITLSSFNNISHLELEGDRDLITYR